MSKSKIPNGVVIDIQAVGTTISEQLQRQLFSMLDRVQRFFKQIDGAAFYLQQTSKRNASPRTLKLRLSIPGPDLFASDSGKNWKALVKRVEQKIVQQVKGRKE